jgi:hypothetical protein
LDLAFRRGVSRNRPAGQLLREGMTEGAIAAQKLFSARSPRPTPLRVARGAGTHASENDRGRTEWFARGSLQVGWTRGAVAVDQRMLE